MVPPVTTRRLPQQRYADLLLGRSVDDFIAERRANGDSFRRIARDLADATSGEIDVSDVTVGTWYRRSARQTEDVA